jgi:hypothetical protein
MIDPSAKERAERYLSLCPEPVNLKRFLGGGTDGYVWETSRETALKALVREAGYYNERDTYLRLQEWGLTEQIDGFWVPEILGYSDELWVIEMDMVQHPPYIIDFAKVRLDRPPDFSEEVLEEAERRGVELFERHWPEVKSLLATLESYQIYYLDARPGNIAFPDLP